MMSAVTNKKPKACAIKAPSDTAVDKAVPRSLKTSNTQSSSGTAQPARRHDNVASLLRLQANAKFTKDRVDQCKGSASSDTVRGPRCPDSNSAKHSYPGSNSIRAEHRAQSVQNVCRIPTAISSNTKTHLPVGRTLVKRAASSQNISSSSKSSQPLRPPVDAAAAYNAELLANFEREKKNLEARIADLTCQLDEAKEREEASGNADELTSLRTENESLREQLAKEQQLRASSHDEHFTDAEKLRLLQWQTHSPQQRNSVSDLRASFDSTPVTPGGLDRRSSVSVDCVLDHGPTSVAALRDRLALMKDAHDSTVEELEATLQELDDLQHSVCELTSDNEKLTDERTILLQSLCTQTEKLEHARLQVEHLKTLLLSGSSPQLLRSVAGGCVEPDLATALVHGVEEERDELRLRQTELSHALKQLEAENSDLRATVGTLRDALHAAEGQYTWVEEEVKVSKDVSSMLDSKQLAKCLADSKVELQKYQSTCRELDDRISALDADNCQLNAQLAVSKDQLDRIQHQLFEDREASAERQTSLESDLASLRHRCRELELWLTETTQQFDVEYAEWLQLQKDLQVAVVVANDFRTEAQHSFDTVLAENQSLRDRVASLTKELAEVHHQLAATTFRGETRRSFSLPDNKLAASSLSPQPTSSASSSLIASIDENCLRSPVDSGTPPQCTINRTSSSTDAKSPVCDVIVTSHDVQSPIRNVRPALLDIAAVQSPRVDSSPDDRKQLVGILLNRSPRRNSLLSSEVSSDKAAAATVGVSALSIAKTTLAADPLASLAKQLGGSKRNALLRWCQNRTATYTGIDVTNFSSSWSDGLAFCALLHTYLPDKIPYKELNSQDKVKNFLLAVRAAESVGIHCVLNLNDIVATERPDWQAVMNYVTAIYKHFEVDNVHVSP